MTARPKRTTLLSTLPGAVLVACAAAGGVLALWNHDAERSVIDGRSLTEFAWPTVTTIASGEFMAQFDAYVDDRLPGRTTWLTLHAVTVADGLRDPVVDGVYINGPQGTLLEQPNRQTVPDGLATSGQSLADAAHTAGAEMLWIYAPRKEEIYSDSLPTAWPDPMAERRAAILDDLAESAPVLDLTDLLVARASAGVAYFQSDHHWTPATALAAVDETSSALAQLGVTIGSDEREYSDRESPYRFYGSTGRRVTAGVTEGDAFTFPIPVEGFDATMCIGDACGLDTVNLATVDDPTMYANRYAGFIDGDNGLTVITNDSPDATGTVVLLKDSYGNPFATYLAERVSTLYVIDERHYDDAALNQLLDDVAPDVVMALHNQVSLLSDNFDFSVWTETAPVGDLQLYDRTWADGTGWLFNLNPDQPLDDSLAADAQVLASAIGDRGIPQLWLYAPRREEVFADLLPSSLPNPTLEKKPRVLELLRAAHDVVDLTPLLSDPDERDAYYFRTDHHWTQTGASVATEAIVTGLDELGVDVQSDSRPWLPSRITVDFYGSLAVGLPDLRAVEPDAFTILEPDGGLHARVCTGLDCSGDPIASEWLAAEDIATNRFYAYLDRFYGNRHLHNDSPDAQGTIVMLGDSYSTPVAIELAERFTDLYLIDERFADDVPLSTILEETQPDAVVILHNQVSLLSEAFDRDVWRSAAE